MKPKDGLTRRDLIKNAGLAGAAAATGGLVGPTPAAAQAPQAPTRWDREADVVMIGSGATGHAGGDRRARGRLFGHHRRSQQ